MDRFGFTFTSNLEFKKYTKSDLRLFITQVIRSLRQASKSACMKAEQRSQDRARNHINLNNQIKSIIKDP